VWPGCGSSWVGQGAVHRTAQRWRTTGRTPQSHSLFCSDINFVRDTFHIPPFLCVKKLESYIFTQDLKKMLSYTYVTVLKYIFVFRCSPSVLFCVKVLFVMFRKSVMYLNQSISALSQVKGGVEISCFLLSFVYFSQRLNHSFRWRLDYCTSSVTYLLLKICC
jgi:hypothetical protein